MGKHNPKLQIDALLTGVSCKALIPSSTRKCSQECDFEALVRSYLQQNTATLHLGKNIKKCGKKDCNDKRQESIPFKGNCEKWDDTNNIWVPKQPYWHNDIVFSYNNKLFVVEIKRVDKHMVHLCHNQPVCHVVDNNFHFNNPYPKITVDSPCHANGYYSYLAEGQIWMDILRLNHAKTNFKASKPSGLNDIELYILLFSETDVSANIASTLDVFDTRWKYLYHPHGFRSSTINFEYNYATCTIHKIKNQANLIRIAQQDQ